MKNIIIHMIAVCAVLMPMQQVDAKTYGGFKKGQKFKMYVHEIIKSKAVGTKISKKASIPKGVPKYKKGKKVKFKIGKKGQITAKGLSIPFNSDGGSANIYSRIKTGTTTKAYTAEVFKNAKGKPSGVVLAFVVSKYAGFQTTTTTVSYILGKKKKP